MSESAEHDAKFRYKWFVPGDINGFFGMIADNLAVMSFMAFILIGIFQFPSEIVFTKMFPGTAFGVLFGDLVYTYMAIKLAYRLKNPDVTAMPLGLDTPSSIGVCFAVLGPVFLGLKAEMVKAQGLTEVTPQIVNDAALQTWYVGMATMVIIGVIKLVFSFAGSWIQRIVPEAGLLGSLAGIGLALIGLIPLLEIFSMPIVGMVALGLILYTLVAGIRLPGNFPGVAAAVVAGLALYYGLGLTGQEWLLGGHFHSPELKLHFGLPIPTLHFLKGMSGALAYLPVAVPFAILTVIGGVNVTESARVGGDEYDTRSVLLTEAVATLIAGVCGGVAQSTPYIGQPAYKAMGSRAGYTLLTGLFIGLGGIFGFLGFIVEAVPKAILAPILVFVALDIIVQAFHATPRRHGPAVALAHIPTLARLLAIKYSGIVPAGVYRYLIGLPGDISPEEKAIFAGYLRTGESLNENMVITALGNGFILTAMLWGGMMALLVDRKLRSAAGYMLLLAVLTWVGVTHSVMPDGNMYNPLSLPEPARRIPFLFTTGYLILAGMFFALSFSKQAQEPPTEGGHGH